MLALTLFNGFALAMGAVSLLTRTAQTPRRHAETSAGLESMSTILVEFADITQDPARRAIRGNACEGHAGQLRLMPLIGLGSVEYRDYAAHGMLKRVMARFPTAAHRRSVCHCGPNQISNLMGTHTSCLSRWHHRNLDGIENGTHLVRRSQRASRRGAGQPGSLRRSARAGRKPRGTRSAAAVRPRATPLRLVVRRYGALFPPRALARRGISA